MKQRSTHGQQPRKRGTFAAQTGQSAHSARDRRGRGAFGDKPHAALRDKPGNGQRDKSRDAGGKRIAAPASVPSRHPFRPRQAGAAKPNAKPAAPAFQRKGVLLWGLHAVRAAWQNPARTCFGLYLTESNQAALDDIMAATDPALPRPAATIVTREELDRMLPPNSVHQGIVLDAGAVPELLLHEILAAEPPPDFIVVLDQVTDPHNIGAIMRSAVAFGAGALIMTERHAPQLTGAMAKTASGAAEHIPQIHVVNLSRALKDLRQAGYWCVGLAEQGERSLAELDLSGRTALVLGAEGDGLRRLTRDNCDELARLPTGGPIGSLNVSNAAAVALYEVKRQRGK